MVDLELLRKNHGLTQEALKEWLYSDLNLDPGNTEVVKQEQDADGLPAGPVSEKAEPEPEPADEPTTEDATAEAHEKLMRGRRSILRNRIRSRIQEGLNRNLTEGRHYYALDQAWDAPFRQITPTLLQSLLDKNPTDEDVTRAATDWGLAHLITEEKDAKTQKPVKKLNLPIFNNVFVPLVKAYVTIRWAKIINDRRLTPLLKFEPAKMTMIGRLKCEAITDRVQVMSLQFGYFKEMEQAVLKMLHYSYTMQFIKEEWHTEEQERFATEVDVAAKTLNSAGLACQLGEPVTVLVKEGLRFHRPHPSRTIRDLNHPAYTYNTDTGCEYAGYWRIMRYRDLTNGDFWNTDKISIGATDLIGDNAVFFTTVYPCTMSWPNGVAVQPQTPSGSTLAVEAGSGVGELDREKKMANQFYTTDHADQAVLVTEYFEKFVPVDNGLGTYKYPVWFRFVVAGDQATILYAAPLPSTPVTYLGYDEDGSRSMNASMTLEVAPFQDQFGNLLSQLLLSIKQNLANLVLIDEDQVEPKAVDKISNWGERFFRGLNLQGFSSRKANRAQNRPVDAIHSFKFPQVNTSEIVAGMKTILDTLERVLVMSSQEVGQAASHEQTREEIINIKQTSSTRQTFTATGVDLQREAWKRQIYAYLMAYGEDTFYAHIPSDIPLTDEVLGKMGFSWADDGIFHKDVDLFRKVKGSKKSTAMDLYEFASAKDGDDRTNDKEIAATIAGLVKDLLANEMTAQAIGPQQAIALANQIAYYAGLPRDFKLQAVGQPAPSPEEQKAQAQAQLKQIVDAVLPVVQQGMEPLVKATKDNTVEIAAIMRALHLAPNHPANDSPNPEPVIGHGG